MDDNWSLEVTRYSYMSKTCFLPQEDRVWSQLEETLKDGFGGGTYEEVSSTGKKKRRRTRG
jgi:hypothetical protein